MVKRGGFRGTKVDVIVDEKVQPPRRYTDIVAMISESTLDSAVRQGALDIFHRLGEVEARLHDEQLLSINEYMHPRLQEICETLPAPLGRWLQRPGWPRRLVERFTQRGRVVTTSSLRGFLMLYAVAGMKRWRRG